MRHDSNRRSIMARWKQTKSRTTLGPKLSVFNQIYSFIFLFEDACCTPWLIELCKCQQTPCSQPNLLLLTHQCPLWRYSSLMKALSARTSCCWRGCESRRSEWKTYLLSEIYRPSQIPAASTVWTTRRITVLRIAYLVTFSKKRPPTGSSEQAIASHQGPQVYEIDIDFKTHRS